MQRTNFAYVQTYVTKQTPRRGAYIIYTSDQGKMQYYSSNKVLFHNTHSMSRLWESALWRDHRSITLYTSRQFIGWT